MTGGLVGRIVSPGQPGVAMGMRRWAVGLVCALALVAADLAVVVPAAAQEPSSVEPSALPGLESEPAPAPALEPPREVDGSLPAAPSASDRNAMEVLGKRDETVAPAASLGDGPGGGYDKDESQRVDELTTDRQVVFENPDGSRTAVLSATPVRFQDESGVWQDVDLSLEDSAAGKRAKASALPVTLLDDPASGQVRWDTPDGPLTTRVAGIDGLAKAQTTKQANQVRWDGPANVSVTAALTTSGVNQDVVLADAVAPSSYEFELELPTGWSARLKIISK